jgi:hypothetical protein
MKAVKKITVAFLTLLIVCSFASCGDSDKPKEVNPLEIDGVIFDAEIGMTEDEFILLKGDSAEAKDSDFEGYTVYTETVCDNDDMYIYKRYYISDKTSKLDGMNAYYIVKGDKTLYTDDELENIKGENKSVVEAALVKDFGIDPEEGYSLGYAVPEWELDEGLLQFTAQVSKDDGYIFTASVMLTGYDRLNQTE